MKIKVVYGEVEKTFNPSNTKKVCNFLMRDVKPMFGIESSIVCHLYLGDFKLQSSKALNDQKNKKVAVNIGSECTLTLHSTGQVRKRIAEEDKIEVVIKYERLSESFKFSKSYVVQDVVAASKSTFKLPSNLEMHLELDGTKLKTVNSLESCGVEEGSVLHLVQNEVQRERRPESKEVVVKGMTLNVVPLRVSSTKVAEKSGLYTIIEKMSKNEHENHEKPLSLVNYIGTVTNTSFEARFEDHCKKRFDKENHRLIPIMTFSKDTLEDRFVTCEEAAVGYELLADCLRLECSFVKDWRPGTSSKSFNNQAFSKMTAGDLSLLAGLLIDKIRNAD